GLSYFLFLRPTPLENGLGYRLPVIQQDVVHSVVAIAVHQLSDRDSTRVEQQYRVAFVCAPLTNQRSVDSEVAPLRVDPIEDRAAQHVHQNVASEVIRVTRATAENHIVPRHAIPPHVAVVVAQAVTLVVAPLTAIHRMPLTRTAECRPVPVVPIVV